jgi:hypothetical protein
VCIEIIFWAVVFLVVGVGVFFKREQCSVDMLLGSVWVEGYIEFLVGEKELV